MAEHTDSGKMTDVKRDEAELLSWLNDGGFYSDKHPAVAVRRIIAERDAAQSELAALRAKLPRYANGEAFVPGVDECHVMIGGEVCYGYPTYNRSRRQWSYYNPGFKGTATRAYPTAAECGEGEGWR